MSGIKFEVKDIIGTAREYADTAENLVNRVWWRRKQNICRDLATLFEPYVPRKTGALRNNVSVTVNGIKYNQPYADAQYTTQFKHYTTEGTGPNWDEVAINTEWDRYQDIIVKNLSKK